VTERTRKSALLIAYHFPPVGISSGLQRPLAFCRYLGEYGWEPHVLSVDPRAYVSVREDQLTDVPNDVEVVRAFARDVRQLGWYPSFLAIPDRWSSWLLGGVPAGLRLIRRHSPSVIWSTFPIATAHLIAYLLHRFTGIPWVADIRDPMTEPGYADRPGHRWLERRVVASAARLTFTTPSTVRLYAERYPERPRQQWVELPNGYDDDIFRSVPRPAAASGNGPLVLLHSGILYPVERDPGPFFAAVARLRDAGAVDARKLRVVLRATGHDETYARLIAQHRIGDIVELGAAVPYREALAEMLAADGLLIFQAASCNIQIPAKIYECLRAERPIFALTDGAGDTAGVLRSAGIDTIAQIDDADAIAAGLRDFLVRVRAGTAPVAPERVIGAYSRKSLTADLARCFDSVATEAAAARSRKAS
jgi:glycosyltransferase involved in cell wall biosynthesis